MRPRRSVMPPAVPPRARSQVTAVVAVFAVMISLLLPTTAATAVPAEAVASTAPAAVGAELSVSEAGLAEAGIVKTSLVGFDPGNIISDALFYDGAAMTAAQIQAFLDQKIGACRNGKCLNVANATIQNRAKFVSQTTGQLVCEAVRGGTMRASELIYRMQTACGISAKVILVTLQKEQGLVTSKAPSDWNIRAAMGMGCPDGAPCSTVDAGLGLQIANGVEQMKKYKATRFGKQPGRQFIGYHPTASLNCGGTYVDVANYATAALYNYTPYQPNAAALNAGYGLGDACSSYGNRNFYNYYNDWFGTTGANACTVPPFVSSAAGLYVVSDAAVNARQAPTTECSEGVRSIAQNTLVARTGTYDDWARVTDGATAWIRQDLLTPILDTPAPTLELDDRRHVFGLASDGSILGYPFSSVGRWGNAVALSGASALTRIVEVGDFDGDGHRDLIGIDGDAKPLLLRGDGTSLSSSTRMRVSWAGQRLITAAGDFDGDGVSDVFSVNASGYLYLWRGDGRSGFRTPTTIGQGWGGMTALAGGADFTGDDTPDLLARDAAGRLYLYAGDGKGGWRSGNQIGVGWGAMSTLISTGDFTGDGRNDLLARDAGGALHLYSGTTSGFAYLAQVGVGWGGMRAVAGAGIAIEPVARAAGLPGTGDLDGDGFPDVAALSAAGLSLYSGNGNGGWRGSSVLDASWRIGDRIVPLGDFTGDGMRDLGRIRADGSFVLHSGVAGGGIGPATQIGAGWGGLGEVFGTFDFDGDGNIDVLARSSNGLLLLYRGNGRGGWAEGGRVVGTGWNMFDRIFAAGDFDGDGNGDVLARTPAGGLWLYPTTGASGWGAPRQIGVGWGGFTSIFSPGDFDGSGAMDVMARTAGGALYLYRGDGKGGWLGGAQIGVGWSSMRQIE